MVPEKDTAFKILFVSRAGDQQPKAFPCEGVFFRFWYFGDTLMDRLTCQNKKDTKITVSVKLLCNGDKYLKPQCGCLLIYCISVPSGLSILMMHFLVKMCSFRGHNSCREARYFNFASELKGGIVGEPVSNSTKRPSVNLQSLQPRMQTTRWLPDIVVQNWKFKMLYVCFL